MVFNRALTPQERERAEVYLADKYGLYHPDATWPTNPSNNYSAAVQAEITRNQWNKAQADAYVAFLASNPPVSPTGLVTWLRADQNVTADPTTGLVSQWSDQSLYQNNANQGNTGYQPTLIASRPDLNNEPVVRFNGGSYLDITDNPSLKPSSAVTVIALAQNSSSGQQDIVSHSLTYNYYGAWALAPLYSYDLGVQPNNVERGYIGFGSGADNWYADLPGSTARPHQASISTMIYDGNNLNIYDSGGLQATQGISGPINYDEPNLHDMLIGTENAYYGVANYFSGDVGEVLVYNRALTPQEQEQAEVYLADKYGVYHPDATWPEAYSSDVQALITANQWTKAQADAYVMFLSSNPSVPADGLVVWLKADAGVTSSNGSVSQWADQSPYQNNANQGNGGNQPTFITSRSDLNGKPVVRFNGSSYLDVTDNTSLRPSSAVTVIALAQNASSGQQDIVSHSLTYNYYGAWALSPLYSYDLGVQPDNVERGYIGFGSGASNSYADLPGSTARPQQASISTMIYDGNNLNIYDSGALQATQGISGPINYDGVNPHDLLIGAENAYNGVANYFKGDVGEVLVYNRALSGAEQQQVEAYLADKFGVYHPDATWPEAFSSEVQALITTNHWTEAQANAYVAFQATNPPVPASGLQLWLRADEGVTADGSGNISQWADQGPIQENATQTTAGNQPQFVTNVINGEPVVRFNGSSAYLQLPSGFSNLTSGVTAFAVFSPTTTAGSERIFDIGNGAPFDNTVLSQYGTQATMALTDFRGSIVNQVYGGNELSISVPQEYTAIQNGGTSMALYQNGSLVAQTTNGVTALNNVLRQSNFIGKSNWSSDPLYQGDMAEILIYNRTLTSSEQEQVEVYLADKYGLYHPDAAWPLSYDTGVQAYIAYYHWNKAQADAYVAFLASNPPAPAVPSSGLQLWLRADAGVAYDGSNNVTTWSDQTGNYPVTQSGSAEPTYVANDINGEPALRFNGSQFLANSGNMGLNADMTVITVAMTTAPASQGYMTYLGPGDSNGSGGGANQGTNRALGYTNSQQLFDTSGIYCQGAATPAAGTFVAEAATLDSTLQNVVFYRNGVQTATGRLSGVQNLGAGITVGSTPDPSSGWQGDIAEVLVYDHKLSSSDFAQVDGYLANKYGYYSPNATWPLAYSSLVQFQILINQWNKAQADAYVAFQSDNPGVMTDGLTLWLRADAGVTTSNGSVTAIADQTGNYTLTQVAAVHQPTYVANDINGEPALRFNGSQWLASSGTLAPELNQDMTVITVGMTTNPAVQEYAFYAGANNGTAGINRAIGYHAGDEFFDTAGSADGALAPLSGVFVAEGATLNSNPLLNVSFYRNGVLTATGTVSGMQNLSSGITLGAAGGGTSGWQGDIAEVLVYDHQLSTAEMQQVGVYLANKYGLSTNVPPVISPSAGSYSSTQTVSISSGLTTGMIHYTIDGTTPTATSPVYTGPISLSASALVQAAVFSSTGQAVSQIASAQFYINDPDETGLAPAPAGLTVTAVSSSEIDLSWSLASLPTYSQVYVYRSTGGGGYELIAVLGHSVTSFADTTVTAGTSYTYKVGTLNQAGIADTAASSSVSPSSASTLTITVTTPSGATDLP
jgi:hypothetical protein